MFKSYDEIIEVTRYTTINELIAAGFDPSKPDMEGVYVLNPVCKRLNVELVYELIQAGANVNAVSADGYTPLLSAIEYSHHDSKAAVEVISLLLDNGADIEGRGDWDKTPFLKSCTRGVIEITRLLVSRGCDIHAKANEIGGLMGAREFADMPSNSTGFKRYIDELLSNK
ncbi:ankyrin repeat domain-containing protein [Marinobacter mangrovi]|uniref:ankyrin repeat domain-containing protein n=1 Tax=Marinobacter mangrovi TaxID=2803918 RepID=UPI0019313736|nr:ankyrin repeat domain-containing protein [Marinobacter mangrovi]